MKAGRLNLAPRVHKDKVMNSNNIQHADRMVARKEQMLRELASDLADLVANGDMTAQQANEWLAMKQDQWLGGDQ